MKAKRKRIIVCTNTKLNTLERANKGSLKFKLRTVKVVVCLIPAMFKYKYRKVELWIELDLGFFQRNIKEGEKAGLGS